MNQIAPDGESNRDQHRRVLLENREAEVIYKVLHKTGEFPKLEEIHARAGESNEFYKALFQFVWHEEPAQ